MGKDRNFWKMVDCNIELKALWASSYNTTQFGCKFNIVQMPWTIVSHPPQAVTPNWWKLKCSMKVSINWIANVFVTRQQVTSLIAMGRMPLDCFSNVMNWDAKNKHNTKNGIWSWTMCPHTFLKRSNPLTKSSATK